MADRSFSYLWGMRLLFLALCLVLIFLNLLPLGTAPKGWAGPDLILALTFAWLLRRPEIVPALLIAPLFLLTDLLFQKPPGLWAALVLLGTEAMRARAALLRDLTFAAEWLNVATTLTVMTIGYQLVLAVLFVDRPPIALNLTQMVTTLAVYPLVVLVSQYVFGVRKPAPGDLDTMGNRQ